jgi:hypothetical protein
MMAQKRGLEVRDYAVSLFLYCFFSMSFSDVNSLEINAF